MWRHSKSDSFDLSEKFKRQVLFYLTLAKFMVIKSFLFSDIMPFLDLWVANTIFCKKPIGYVNRLRILLNSIYFWPSNGTRMRTCFVLGCCWFVPAMEDRLVLREGNNYLFNLKYYFLILFLFFTFSLVNGFVFARLYFILAAYFWYRNSLIVI